MIHNIAICCGRGCSSQNDFPKKLDKDFVIGGYLHYDSFGMHTSGYIAQKLSQALVLGHKYHYYMFYNFFHYAPRTKLGYYERLNRIPNAIHNGFGVAFSTYYLRFDSLYNYP